MSAIVDWNDSVVMKWQYRCVPCSIESKGVLCVWNMQVVYCDSFQMSDVYKKDFFHNAFKMLLEPESEMFMYSDTLIWFPVQVRQKKEK